MGPTHGPWAPEPPCWGNDDCDEAHYCFLHVCAVETGVCMPRPEGCQEAYDPVCGCDGETYGNACIAAMSGMSVDYWGPCCAADLDGDGNVGFSDLLRLLGAWGPCGGCPEDLDRSGDVGLGDLLIVVAAWGSCE